MDYRTVNGLIGKFEENFGSREGLFCSRAPGRVNLIGEHTDYNGGFVLPMALDREVRVLFRSLPEGEPVRVWAENIGEWDEFHLDGVERNPRQAWSNYVRGVAAMLAEEGFPPAPFEGIVFGDVPIGAGLSSSAAVEVACAKAFCAGREEPEPRRLALLCQRAENEFVGVNCGIMDQFVSVHARRQYALLLDCRSLEYDHVPLDTTRVRVVVANTMVHHELGSSAYNERRASCEEAARRLGQRVDGVEQLRDVTSEMLRANADLLDETLLKRARHVVSEDERTLGAAEALRAEDYELFGRLMDRSHESLRDDYEVSCEELDAMVEAARRQQGVFGARMVGAGFGGCTVNLVRREHVDNAIRGMAEAYAQQTGIRPEIYECSATGGAELERC